MLDMSVTRLYELTIILYASSVLLYFIDFLQHNRKANRVAFWLLSIVWLLQSTFLVIQMIKTGRLPILTVFEGLYFYAWVLISLSLVINRLLKVDFLVFFTNLLGFFIMALHTFAPAQHESAVVAQQLVSELLIIHITMALLSYGALTVSFVLTVLYVIQYNLLKQKKWGKRLLRINDLSKLEHVAYLFVVHGVATLLLALLLGIIWAYVKVPHFQWYDAKVTGSFTVLAVYCVYLYLRVSLNVHGKKLALWNIAAFFVLLINFFLFGSLSRFHFWYS
ncbi:cytochrome C assembly protein [Bacillus sp. HMF5848]|uniref:cytochrome C assembly family protein n=1 Tax=Bacillus sp. HMF5848 TaxID=2495421 RepID=UPI000F7907B3|nr:cytochrome c biogenesis protein CcsA [Bacillus sp. HMF5848]RSK28044.1 cytochrome C assembly protein [Bacillus sp. HMF5848]